MVMSTTDANAIAEVVFVRRRGVYQLRASRPRASRRTMVWNAQTHTAGNVFLNDPDLISAPNRGGNKIVPTSIFFHDRGAVLDLNPVEFTLGSSPPPDARAPRGWYLGTIDSVGTGTVHVTPNVPLTVTSTMAHDGGSVVAEAWLNTEIAAQTGWTNPIMTGLYVPQGQYRVFNTLIPPTFTSGIIGLHIYGDGGKGDDVGSAGATSFVNMIEGNVAMALTQQQALPEIDHLMVREGGGSTAGVCLDLDSPNIPGAATGTGYIHEATFAGCNEGIRAGNDQHSRTSSSSYSTRIGWASRTTAARRKKAMTSSPGNSLGHIISHNNVNGGRPASGAWRA